MDNPSGTIAVGVDDASSAADALEWAVAEARMTGRAITLVHVVPPIDPYQQMHLARAGVTARTARLQELAAGHVLLDSIGETLRDRGVVVRCAVGSGDPGDVLPAMSAQAFRLVVGSHGRGRVMSRVLGSVSGAVVRNATCPVVVARPRNSTGHGGVIVSASTSEEGQAALAAAFLEAEGRQCALTIVTCDPGVEPESPPWSLTTDRGERELARLAIAEAVAGLRADHPDVEVSIFVAEGSLLSCLLDLGGENQEIVVDRRAREYRHGHVGEEGSLAVSLIEHASTTVMVV